jgi:hypothetical protein
MVWLALIREKYFRVPGLTDDFEKPEKNPE